MVDFVTIRWQSAKGLSNGGERGDRELQSMSPTLKGMSSRPDFMKGMIRQRNGCLGYNDLVENPSGWIAFSLTKLNFIALFSFSSCLPVVS